MEQKIYDEPCDVSRPATPEAEPVKTDFQKLRENFETLPEVSRMFEKPKISKKPLTKIWKSTENVSDEFKFVRKTVEKKFATDSKKYRRTEKGDKVGFSLPKNDSSQLDVDRENVSILMRLTFKCRFLM
ncbi:unnamed protein product [Colias eurytheme]|nr:unnamed protein product [Colias eurytheme]